MYSHIVIVGGTGMLADVSRALADRCRVLTSVARTQRSLDALDEVVVSAGCEHRMLALDWTEPDDFLERLIEHVRCVGSPGLVLAWLHEDQLGPRIAQALASGDGACRFFQVRGSTAASPANNTESFFRDSDIPETVDYYQIILGFRRENKGSRWLSHTEIASGVLSAIDNPRPVSVVGTVEPWSGHP